MFFEALLCLGVKRDNFVKHQDITIYKKKSHQYLYSHVCFKIIVCTIGPNHTPRAFTKVKIDEGVC